MNNKKGYLKCASKPGCMSHKIYDNNLVAIPKSRLELKFNKSAYIGMCILELRKVLMYDFHYDYIKNEDDKKSKLLFTDTDSLMYEIKIEDYFEEFSSNDNSNKLVIGKMKPVRL